MRRMAMLFAAAAALACAARREARADIGPKPTETFDFDRASVSIAGRADLMQCERPDCSDAKPLSQVGPQHFACHAGSCAALAYGFAEHQKLVVAFSDGKVRESAVFPRSRALNASFAVALDGERLRVRETTPAGAALSAAPPAVPAAGSADRHDPRLRRAMVWTLAIEIAIAGLFAVLWKRFDAKRTRRLLLAVAAANVFSLIGIWTFLPLVVHSILGQEALVCAFEAAVVYAVNKDDLSLKDACLLSFVMNAASVVGGFFLGL